MRVVVAALLLSGCVASRGGGGDEIPQAVSPTASEAKPEVSRPTTRELPPAKPVSCHWYDRSC